MDRIQLQGVKYCGESFLHIVISLNENFLFSSATILYAHIIAKYILHSNTMIIMSHHKYLSNPHKEVEKEQQI
jgi:hypothetical protein